MPEVRFAVVYYPGDGVYRIVDPFRDYQNLDECYFEVQQPTISRTPFGCLIDKAGRYHPELATRGCKIENVLASVDIHKTETQIIKRRIKDLETLDLGREPPLRSHARGLMSRFNMDKLDGINVHKVLENNPAFYSREYKAEDDTVIYAGENVTSIDGGVHETVTAVCQDGEAVNDTFIAEKPLKTSVKKRFKNFFRRLCCIPLKAEE